MRVLGLDVGDKYIGVAISDAEGITAHGLNRIKREEWVSTINSIIKEYDGEIGLIIVGLPRMLDGSVGIQAEKVIRFTEELKRVISLPVIMWDERLSSVEADKTMLGAGINGRRRKILRDKVAAVIILQSYLDSKR
ncbi:MAG: Holliday junction resolvase RuvX [Thermodesulfovibrionia bacterium]